MDNIRFVAEWLNFALWFEGLTSFCASVTWKACDQNFPQMKFIKIYFTKLSIIKMVLEYPENLPSDLNIQASSFINVNQWEYFWTVSVAGHEILRSQLNLYIYAPNHFWVGAIDSFDHFEHIFDPQCIWKLFEKNLTD